MHSNLASMKSNIFCVMIFNLPSKSQYFFMFHTVKSFSEIFPLRMPYVQLLLFYKLVVTAFAYEAYLVKVKG